MKIFAASERVGSCDKWKRTLLYDLTKPPQLRMKRSQTFTCSGDRPLLSNESILAPNPSNAFNEDVASFFAAKCKGVCPSPVERESISAPF